MLKALISIMFMAITVVAYAKAFDGSAWEGSAFDGFAFNDGKAFDDGLSDGGDVAENAILTELGVEITTESGDILEVEV